MVAGGVRGQGSVVGGMVEESATGTRSAGRWQWCLHHKSPGRVVLCGLEPVSLELPGDSL